MQDYERIRPHIVADAKRPYDLFEVEERLQATLSFFGKAERLKRWQLMALEIANLRIACLDSLAGRAGVAKIRSTPAARSRRPAELPPPFGPSLGD